LYKNCIVRDRLETVVVYSSAEKVNPNGARILSWTTLFATSPPCSSATAPTMAYNEVMSTDSIPDAWRLSAYIVLAYCTPPFQLHARTLFGVHLVTLSRPYRSAICESRALSKTLLSASSDSPCKPVNAGCWNGFRPYWSTVGRASCGEFMSACDVCSSTIRRPECC
jgi:hypothetical protein